jgi:ribonuclease P protein component
MNKKQVRGPPAGSRRTVAPARMGGQPCNERTHDARYRLNAHFNFIHACVATSPPFRGEGIHREAHISAEDASSRASPRISRAHEDDRWPQSVGRSSRAWSQAHHCRLIPHDVVRAARLRRSSDIALVRAEGRSLRRAAFSARIRRTSEPGSRIAVIASRAVGTAVARNRAKRRVREAFRRALASSEAGPSIDLLITVRPESLQGGFAAMQADAASVLREAGA